MPPPAPRSVRPWLVALVAVVLAAGVMQAARASWTADDAYISFRYARHLIEGRGLVFNAGERVEGYSNFLWTLLVALGMRFGARPEPWAAGLGIACYAATLALLARLAWRRAAGVAVPIAAVAWALTPDAWTYATAGLETSLFTLLAVTAYATLTAGRLGPLRAARAGAVLALVALARPDGALWVAVGLGFVVAVGRPRGRAALACAGTLALLLVPYAVWKLSYYGELLPNTYYAKSAAMAWWSQGFAYLGLFLRRYPLLLAALPSAAIAVARPTVPAGTPEAMARRHEAALAAAFALAHVLYVVRVGGDFMFARFLIPATPFLLILIERGVAARVPGRMWVQAGTAAALAVSFLVVPAAVPRGRDVRGVVDEREYYRGPEREATVRMGERLRRYAAGLPLRLSFGGAQAIVAYLSRAPVAIESAAGLTDRWIARQPLAARGRIGHEKPAPWLYLIETRRAHLVPGRSRALDDTLAAYVPPLTMWIEDDPFTLLTWDPPLMDELAARGARVPDFVAGLDEFLREIDALPDSVVRAEYERLERFYFAGWNDPVREGPLRDRLGLPRAVTRTVGSVPP